MNGAAYGGVLPKREMSADLVIVGCVVSQDPMQMCLAEHHDMIEALTPDRADEAFNMTILPRRAGRDRSVPDAHRLEPPCDDHAIGAIPIADEQPVKPDEDQPVGVPQSLAGAERLRTSSCCRRKRISASRETRDPRIDASRALQNVRTLNIWTRDYPIDKPAPARMRFSAATGPTYVIQ